MRIPLILKRILIFGLIVIVSLSRLELQQWWVDMRTTRRLRNTSKKIVRTNIFTQLVKKKKKKTVILAIDHKERNTAKYGEMELVQNYTSKFDICNFDGLFHPVVLAFHFALA